MKVLSVTLGIFLFLFSMTNPGFTQENTLVVYANSADGQLGRFNADYNNARTGTTATILLSTSEGIQIGQYEHSIENEYRIYRGVLFFDTSALPDTAVITSASLEIYGALKKVENGDFKLRTIHGLGEFPHTPLISGDYDQSNYSGNGGILHTSNFQVGQYNTIPLDSDGIGWIDLSGITHIALRSTHDINAVVPTADTADYVKIFSADETQSVECRPRLVINYTDTPQPNQPPEAPSLLAPDNGGETSIQPTFSWQFNDPDSGDTQTKFELLLNTAADFSGEDLGSKIVTSASSNWTPLEDLTPNTQETPCYYWKCRTFDGEEWGAWSETFTFTAAESQALPPKHILAKSKSATKIYIAWRWDGSTHGYNVYWSDSKNGQYALVNTTGPITNSTNCNHVGVTNGNTYWYKIKGVDANGNLSADSLKVSTVHDADCLEPGEVNYKYIANVDGITESGIVKSGDLNGDGQMDHIIVDKDPQNDDEIIIQAVLHGDDPSTPGIIEEFHLNPGDYFLSTDTWAVDSSTLRAPWTLWDLDNDNKAELVGLRYNSVDPGWDLEIRDGMDPDQIKATARVTNISNLTEYCYKTIAIAYLDGVTPTILYQDGHVLDTQMVFEAYQFNAPNQLTRTWSHTETVPTRGACHYIEVADFDEDGLDEVFFGAYVFDDDLTLFPFSSDNWYDVDGYPQYSLNHPDGVHVADIRPDLPGLEVYYNVESPAGGIHLFKNDGTYVEKYSGGDWRLYLSPQQNNEGDKNHAHLGFTAELGGPEGLELVVCHKSGPLRDAFVVSSTGQRLYDGPNFDDDVNGEPLYYALLIVSAAVDWNGDSNKEVVLTPQNNDSARHVSPGSHSIRESVYSGTKLTFNNTLLNIGAGKFYVRDVIGDYREEVILVHPLGMTIFTNMDRNDSRKVSPNENRQYRQKKLWSGH